MEEPVVTRYYSAKPDGEGALTWPPIGPFESHDAAMRVHARELALQSPTLPRESEPRSVLLDLHSIPFTSEKGMELLLLTDPALHAIFEYGRQLGRLEERRETKGWGER
jgi:hypothetical protein